MLEVESQSKKKTQINLVNMLKYIGFITMFIDHIGMILYPEILGFRIIGRIALPCFIYGIANGVDYTKNVYRYAGRLVIMGVFGNIALMRFYPLSIGFSLALMLLGMHYHKAGKNGVVVLFGLLSLITEYSVYGYLLGLVVYQWKTKKITHQAMAVIQLSLALFAVYVFRAPLQVFMLLFFVVYGMCKSISQLDWRFPEIPKAIGYSFYPVHLAVLQLIRLWL